MRTSGNRKLHTLDLAVQRSRFGSNLRLEIGGLLKRPEAAATEELPDPQQLPGREKAEGEAGAGARAEYGRKLAARERRIRKGRKLRPLRQEPRDEEQINTTDADSGLMRKNDRSEYRRSWVRQTSKTLFSPLTLPCRDKSP